jgi:hypothetical protein
MDISSFAALGKVADLGGIAVGREPPARRLPSVPAQC